MTLGAHPAERHRHGGRWQRLAERLIGSAVRPEAEEPDETASRTEGASDEGERCDRERARIHGTVRNVTVRPRGDVPTLVAELEDGPRTVRVVWLGRRGIVGIEPGRSLTVQGRVTHCAGVPTVFNPSYELQAATRR